MFRFSKVSKSFDGNTVLGGVSFTLSKGECVGLIGANASGKTTLLSIASGELQPDCGSVWLEPGKTVSYFCQNSQVDVDGSVGRFIAEPLFIAATELSRVERLLANNLSCQPDEYQKWQDNYVHLYDTFENLGGYAAIARLHSVLSGLGLSKTELEDPIENLSGGQKTRLALARALMEKPDLLLLDEPTNNLDMEAQAWLAEAIDSCDSAVLIVSHDRAFLDRVTTRTFELEASTGLVRDYSGNYSWYKQRKEQELERQWRQYNDQQQRAEQLRTDIQATKNHALATELTTVHDYLRGRAKKVAAKAKAREKRLTRMLSAENKIEKPRDSAPRIRLNLGDERARTDVLLEAQNIWLGYDDQALLRDVSCSVFGNSRIAILGSNGSGKTTLLKTLMGELPPLAGQFWRHPGVMISYLAQNHTQQLPQRKTVFEYFQEAVSSACTNKKLMSDSEARTFLHRFLFSGQQVFQPIENLSQGQRIKLLMATFMAVGTELLILDEPTNFLDIPARECLEEALSPSQFKGAILLVSHDRFFLRKVETETVWLVKDGGLRQLPTGTDDLLPQKMVV